MSKSNVVVRTSSFGFGVICFWAFVIIKVGGTALNSWSWLWLFLSFIPIISLIAQKLGWL